MVNFRDDLFAAMVQDESLPPRSKGSGRRGEREQGREHRGETRRERKVRRASLGISASLNTSQISRADSTESRDSSTRKKPSSRSKPSSSSRSSRPSRSVDGSADRENRRHRRKEKEETPVDDYGYGEVDMGYGDPDDMGYGDPNDMGYGDGAPSAPAPRREPGRRRERRCSIADLKSGEKEEQEPRTVSRSKSFEKTDFVAPMANQMEKRKNKGRRGSMFGLVEKKQQPEEPEQAPKNHRDRRRKDTLMDRVGNASKRENRSGMSYSDRIMSK